MNAPQQTVVAQIGYVVSSAWTDNITEKLVAWTEQETPSLANIPHLVVRAPDLTFGATPLEEAHLVVSLPSEAGQGGQVEAGVHAVLSFLMDRATNDPEHLDIWVSQKNGLEPGRYLFTFNTLDDPLLSTASGASVALVEP